MTFCPNKSLPEWKALEEAQPINARKLWHKYKGEVPSKYYYPKEVDRKEKAISYLSKLFPGKETIFYDFAKEIGNKTQHGYVENGAINMWTSAEVGTEYHEAYHLLFRTMLSEEQRQSLYKDAAKEFGKPTAEEVEKIKKEVQDLYDTLIGDEEATNLVLEEKMANGFMDHMLTEEESSKGILASIAKWFRDLFSWIKGLISNKIGLRDIYSLMETTKSNDTFLGRGVFRNPQAMNSTYNPSKLVEGIPSATVDKMVEGLTTMAIKEIDSWETAEVSKILGDGKRTNGSIVNGLLYQIYEFKDGRVKSKADIGTLQKAFSLELTLKNAELKYKSFVKQKRTEEAKAFKPQLDAIVKNLADYTNEKGLKTKNLVLVKKGASKRDRDIARKKNTRRTQIMHVIQNWYGKKDSATGNTLVPSWREWVIDELRANQYNITKDVIKEVIKSTNEEEDAENQTIEASDAGSDEKDIKGKSHFADSPANKLSQKVKLLLRSIPILTPELLPDSGKIIYKTSKNPVFTNITQTYSLRYVYKQLAELWADARSFEEMEARLIEKSKYRTDYAAINQRVKSFNNQERALLYHSLANTLAEFNLIILGEDGKVMNANSSSTESRLMSQWTTQIVEVDGQAEETGGTNRAVYAKTLNEDDETKAEFTVKDSKYKSIKDALEKTYKYYSKKFKDDTKADAEFIGKEGAIGSPAWELGSLIWELGMNLGDNINKLSTIKNIQSLLDNGFTATVTEGKRVRSKPFVGYNAFKKIYELGRLEEIIKTGIAPVVPSGQDINIGNKLKNPTPFFTNQKGGMKFLASLAPMFMSRSAESFVTPVNTAIYPINMPTALSEMPVEIKADLKKNKENAFQLYRGDKFIFPPGMAPSHMFNHLLNNEGYQKVFKIAPTAGIRNTADEGMEYEDFNNLDYILTRIEAYHNNGDTKYYLCTVPAPGDRARNDMEVMPRIDGHGSEKLNKTYADVFRDAILQDLFRIKQAKETIADPNATKIDGYHTGQMRGLSDEFMQFDGIDEFGERIVKNKYISGKAGGRDMSDLVESYLNHKTSGMALSDDLNQFEKNLTEMIANLKIFYQKQAEQIATLILDSSRKSSLNTTLLNKWGVKSKGAKREEFIEGASKMIVDFLIHEDLGRNEFIKYTRGNRALFKNIEDFTKRQRLINTPYAKLAEKGTLGKESNRNPTWMDEEYGASPTYNEMVFEDPMGQITQAVQAKLNAWVIRSAEQLVKSGYTAEEAAFTAQYMAGEFEELDGLTLISIDWLRDIMEGDGEWFEYHEIAYKNYKNDPEGKFVYPAGVELPKGAKAGQDIPVKPYKPFAQEVKKVGNTVASDLTKTAYFLALKSYTKAFPIMDDMRMRMEANPLEANNPYAGMEKIHTASARSAKKGVQLNVFDLKNWNPTAGGFFANVKANRNSTSKLGFPQTIPSAKEYSETVFGRQIKKNAIANVKPNEVYYYNAGIEGETPVVGEDMTALYHAAIEEKLRRDFEKMNKQIGLSEFRKVVESLKSQNMNVDAIKGAQDFKEAKRKLLKNIRNLIESQAIEREISDTFLKALDITIDANGITKFAIPLDFPVYGTAFQTALFSIYNNNVFKQYLSGYEAVQTAAIGGFEVNNTLNFLEIVDHAANKKRGTRLAHAEIMVREDVLRKFGVEPGADLDANNIPEELRRIIGYRIPNQDKASTIIFKIKAVLPAGYEKAIVVPPQLVKLMGSDYDVDKMFLLFPELNDEGTAKVKPNYSLLSKTKNVSSVSDKELANIMLDTIEAVFSSPEHYLETLRPLDDEVLKNIRTSLIELNPDLMPTTVFTGGMYETYSAVRNMLGNKLRGLWANAMAGRNVAATSDNFNIHSEFAIKIDREIINTKFLKEIPKTAGYKYDSGLTTDRISSRYTTAAVDATKAPYHYIVNDNTITFPVELLWIHYHGDTELLHFFLNQPIIRDFVEIMSDEFNGDLSSINTAYKRVADKYKISLGSRDLPENYKKIPNTITMNRDSIMKLSVSPARALQNFMKMYTAGRQLKEAFKQLTPDTMSGINRLEAMQSYIERRNKFDNPMGGLMDNAPIAFYGRSKDENVLNQFFDEDSIYGFERGYYNLIKNMVGVASTIFPMTTSAATNTFKEAIKSTTGRDSLTTEQHRDINAAIMFTLLTKDESPLANYMNVEYSERLYKPGYKEPKVDKNKPAKEPKTLWTRIKLALEAIGPLSGNEFLAKLTDDDVNTKVKNFITFNFDATQQFSREEKARIQDDLHNLLYRPEAYLTKPGKNATEQDKQTYEKQIETIKQIGFDLCMHTLIYNGFRKSAFNYASMIPPQFWLQPLNRDAAKATTGNNKLEPISVAEFMHQESMKMQTREYFTTEDLARFFRIYGEIRPGGSNLVDRHTLNEEVRKLGSSHTIKTEKYGGNRYAPAIIVMRTQKGESGVYVKANPTADSKYSVYLNMFKTSNNKKHIVGGDWLNKKTVGTSTEGFKSVMDMLGAYYDTSSRKPMAQDITQICML